MLGLGGMTYPSSDTIRRPCSACRSSLSGRSARISSSTRNWEGPSCQSNSTSAQNSCSPWVWFVWGSGRCVRQGAGTCTTPVQRGSHFWLSCTARWRVSSDLDDSFRPWNWIPFKYQYFKNQANALDHNRIIYFLRIRSVQFEINIIAVVLRGSRWNYWKSSSSVVPARLTDPPEHRAESPCFENKSR